MDIAGNPVKRTVYYRISEYENDKEKENAVIASGEFESPVFRFDVNSLKSGRYSFKFSLNKDFKDDKNSQTANSIMTIYRMNDANPPYATPLWTPKERIVADKGVSKIKINVGSSYSDSWIFMQIADCEKSH